jgi:hypothetical protein
MVPIRLSDRSNQYVLSIARSEINTLDLIHLNRYLCFSLSYPTSNCRLELCLPPPIALGGGMELLRRLPRRRTANPSLRARILEQIWVQNEESTSIYWTYVLGKDVVTRPVFDYRSWRATPRSDTPSSQNSPRARPMKSGNFSRCFSLALWLHFFWLLAPDGRLW